MPTDPMPPIRDAEPSVTVPHARTPLLHVLVPAAECDAASDRLFGMGALGIEERAHAGAFVELIAGLATYEVAATMLGAWRRRWPAWIEDYDPAADLDRWRERWGPVAVDDVAVLVPAGDADGGGVAGADARDADGRIRILLDPGRVFGAGTHATTRRAVAAAVAAAPTARRLLDVGCGTGVVAVAAALAGVEEVVAVDIDPDAVVCAAANAARNGVGAQVRCVVADAADPDALAGSVGAPVDVAVVNLTLDLQARAAPAIMPLLVAGGLVVATGILAEQVAEFQASYPSFPQVKSLVSHADDGQWACVWLRSPH